VSAHILAVDDEPANCRLLDIHLKSQGYRVTTVLSGAAFLEAVDRLAPDLCICDLMLPDANGIDLLRKVREKSPATPVVMFTASDSLQNAIDAMKAGAFDWLTKPLDKEKMFVTIKNALTLAAQAGEISRLRAEVRDTFTFDAIIGDSARMRDAKAMARKFAGSDATALIRGESGAGKELFARALHYSGPRAKGPFVDVNCAALTETLLESEIFGHEKGAFTGAASRHVGKFEQAEGGTIFLDEIGDMPVSTQAKLLRVLQERQFQRVGGTERVTVDVRVISATNQDLEKLVGENRFRQDLFYRINMVTVEVPPLRDRLDDLAALARHFATRAARNERKNAPGFSAAALEAMQAHAWPGNVRELENVVTRAVILCDGLEVLPSHLPRFGQGAVPATPGGPRPASLEDAVVQLEKSMLLDALDKNGWVKARAARALGVSERILSYKCDTYGLKQSKP
jgi:DNA-binding NtrC family response regulator